MDDTAYAELARQILKQYALPWDGIHGLGHWIRVRENGLKIATATGANTEVVELFSLFHDSRRVNESRDRNHGLRGAELALGMRGRIFNLDDIEFELLIHACTDHTTSAWHRDLTVQACFDADRLDLGRAGITPDPKHLCTEAARQPGVLHWAHARSLAGYSPEWLNASLLAR